MKRFGDVMQISEVSDKVVCVSGVGSASLGKQSISHVIISIKNPPRSKTA